MDNRVFEIIQNGKKNVWKCTKWRIECLKMYKMYKKNWQDRKNHHQCHEKLEDRMDSRTSNLNRDKN